MPRIKAEALAKQSAEAVAMEARAEFASYAAHVKAQLGESSLFDHRSYGGKYAYGIPGTGIGRLMSHADLRTNARERYHETSQARCLVDRFVDTVVGQGLQLEPTPKAEIIGISNDEAEVWARDVAARFTLWANNKAQHRAENLSFVQAQSVCVRALELDGESFTRLFYSPDAGLLNPLQFELINANQIAGAAYTDTGAATVSRVINDGIERDARGRNIRYSIWIENQGGGFQKVAIPARGEKSGRVFMLHGFVPDYPGQLRGFSRLGHAIQDFLNITNFEQAQVGKAINQSNLAFISENADQTPGQPLAGFAGNAGRPNGLPSEPSTGNNSMTTSLLDSMANFKMPGAAWVVTAKKGDTIKPVPNTAPSDTYEKFIDGLMGYLSASRGMPLEVLKMSFNSNYSASRAAILLFWRVIYKVREEIASDLLNPIYTAWLTEEIAAGNIKAPGWYNPSIRAAWLECNWIGESAPDIDPVKTAEAVELRLRMGHTTNEREARIHNGSDAEANRRKLRSEWTEEYPLSPWDILKAGSKAETAKTKDSDSSDISDSKPMEAR